MSKHRFPATRLLGGLALAGAALVAAPAAAQADGTTFAGGQPQVFENTIAGRGTAGADASADRGDGALEATADARAGRPFLGLLGGTSSASADETPLPHIAYRGVDQNGGDVVVTLDVAVPEAGSLYLVGRATASARSTRAEYSPHTNPRADGLRIRDGTEIDR